MTAKLTAGADPNSTLAVIGPLYEVDGAFSSLANSAGATFDKNDRQQLSKKPFFAFRENGVLVKSDIIDNETKWHDWELQIDGNHVSWRDLGERPILPMRGWPDPHFFESMSRRYAVQMFGAHDVRIYDQYSSNSVSDDWLSIVSYSYLAQEDLGDSSATLMDDLSTLVVMPGASVRAQRNGNEVALEAFEMNNKKFDRKNHFLVYVKPNRQPNVYEYKDADANPIPLRIGEKLLLLTAPTNSPGDASTNETPSRKNSLKLKDLNQQVVYSRSVAQNELPVGQFSHVEGNQIVFQVWPFVVSDPPDPQLDRIIVSKWDFNQNTLTQFNMHVSDLFELKDDGYYPKRLIHIDTPK